MKPILFSPPMVKAILQGRKTMTRRTKGLGAVMDHEYNGLYVYNKELYAVFVKDTIQTLIKCPYGQPGDVLLVKESFEITDFDNVPDTWAIIKYTNGVTELWEPTKLEREKFNKWKRKIGRRSGLFMFKSMSRLFLENTDIRIERLQDISEEDAKAVGVVKIGASWKAEEELDSPFRPCTYKEAFEALWSSVNGPESRKDNPWVWVISFKQIDKPIS